MKRTYPAIHILDDSVKATFTLHSITSPIITAFVDFRVLRGFSLNAFSQIVLTPAPETGPSQDTRPACLRYVSPFWSNLATSVRISGYGLIL